MSPDDATAPSAIRLGIALGGRAAAGACTRRVAAVGRVDRAWTLDGCTVAPAFHFDGFEIVP